MSQSPSTPIVSWLRDILREKSINTAELARRTGVPRGLVRSVLAGRSPLTVDQLVTWTQVLELDVKDLMGIAAGAEQVDALNALEESNTAPALVPTSAAPLVIDPFGLQAEQTLKMAFELGVNLTFVSDSRQLVESGVPAHVLEQQPEHLVIQLDAAYHSHNAPAYSDEGFSVSLSFDAIYRVVVPWSAITQIILHMEAPDPLEPSTDEPSPSKGASHLRLL